MKKLFATIALLSLLVPCFGQGASPDPGIAVEPQSQTATAGSLITLSVTASGTAPFNYQWFDSAGAIPDATNTIFTLDPAETNESDDYAVTISNDSGSITSSVATVSIGLPPAIVVQPMGGTALVGASISLSVTASGSAPLNYQWYDSTGAIPDATNAIFTLDPAETNDSDNYTVTIENDFGSITSSVATVSIGLPPGILVQPMGGTALVGASISLSVTASGSAPLNYQWYDSTGAIPDATNAIYALDPAETNESDDYTVTIENDFGSITSSLATVSIGLPPAILVQPMGGTASVGGSISLSVTASGSAPFNYQWYDSAGAIPDATNASYTLDPAETNESDDYTVTIENDFGSITSSVATVSIGLPPAILVQPMGGSAPVGGSISLSVTASGSAPLNYQWWNSEGAIPDATNAIYTLDPAETNESDNYTVTINNDFGSITSSVATVSIGLPPGILVQPVGGSAPVGGSISLSVTASGSAPFNYQWYDSAGAIPDATNAIYTLDPAETNESDNYTVTINNDFGSMTSSVATVSIGLPPSILVQPMGGSAPVGGSISLSVTASGSAPLNYQWWNSEGAIPDATNAIYTLDPAETNESDDHTVTIENDFGSITSSVATVSIGLPPSILVQPMGGSAPVGGSISLSVTASGSAPLNYQWWNSEGAIPDATNAIYTLDPTETNESGDYTVMISNDFGSITSSVATVSIGLPPSISVQPVGQSVTAGETVVLSVRANGTSPLSYQWEINGTNLPNGLITTVAGNGIPEYNGDGMAATNANLNIPQGLAVDDLGDLFIVDTGNQRVRKVDTNNLISTVAGNGVWGYSGDGGAATNANFLFPLDVAVGASGQLFIADQDNHCIRQVDINGIITTLVGNGFLGNLGDGGAASNATLSFPHGLAIDSVGDLFIADSGSGFIRRVDSHGIITTTAGNGWQIYSGDGGAATNASLNDPTGVAVDKLGNLYVADSDNNRIRKVDAHGMITTVAGNGLEGYSGDGVAATNASLNDPTGVAVDTLGNLFIADSHNSLVRRVDSAGIISTIAGNYRLNQYNFVGDYSGDGGLATNASLFYPYRVVLDQAGDLFIADLDNNRIRQVVLTTEPAITIHDANTNNEGDYTVIVTNPFGAITSNVAAFNIDLPPTISIQPTGQTAIAGTSVTLSVTASGSAPLSYQWYDSGGAIPDATNAIFTLDPAETNESDDYTVTISNDFGSITSSVATVAIGLPPSISVEPTGQTALVGTPITLDVTASGSTPLNYQWWDSAGAIPSATNAIFTLDPAKPGDSDNYTVTIINDFGSITSSLATLTVDVPPTILVQPVGQSVAVGSSFALSVTAAGSTPLSYQWYDTAGVIPEATNASYTLNPAEPGESDNYTVTINNDFGSITSSAATVNIGLPPAISMQPIGQSVVAGSACRLSVTASGSAPLNYQWYDSVGAIPDATNAILTLDPAETNESDNYTVTIDNDFGSITSSVATISIGLPPAILVQPMGGTAPVGASISLSVTDSGTAPFSYQWYDSVGAIPDATNALYTLDPAETNESDNYTVTIANGFGSITSSVATLSIGLPPSILVQPVGQAGTAGSSLTLSVTAAGSTPLNYQWWNSEGVILDATNASYTLDPAEPGDSDNYAVTINNDFGSITSSEATVTIDLPPSISVQPMAQMVVAGSNATFHVVANGNDLHYQWYGYGGNDSNLLAGATNASLTVLTSGEGSQVYNVSVVVNNLAGEVISSNASLTVLTVLTGPINPYAPGTLGYDLFQSTFTLAGSTNRTASYSPSSSNLGTNSAVWTWPINLSCVGKASDGYTSVLIASNELLTCAHDDGEAGQRVAFHDTNGVSWVGLVTNVISVISDLCISQLSNSAPASIVIPCVLPPNYGDYIAGNSLLGMPAFWLHQGTSTIDYAPVAWIGTANFFGGTPGTWMQLFHNGYGAYSGSSAVPGDSGEPGFLSLSNNPVLLFALDLYPDSGGVFVSAPFNWYWLAGLGLTNGLNILDLSGYPWQSPAAPAPDYNYIAPPTNQLASPGTLVTFDVSVCVFDTSPFAYQWQWNGTNLAGATNAVLTFPAAIGNAGNYSVIVSNELGSVTVGATLTLTSNQRPQILAPAVFKGQFQFGFNTVSNNNYSVQYEDSLRGGNWVVLTNFTGTGSYWQAPSLPLVKQRFYRFITSSP